MHHPRTKLLPSAFPLYVMEADFVDVDCVERTQHTHARIVARAIRANDRLPASKLKKWNNELPTLPGLIHGHCLWT